MTSRRTRFLNIWASFYCLSAMSFSVIFAGCGQTAEKEPNTSGNYSTIALNSSTPAESKSYPFTTLNNCIFDPTTGLFTMTLSGTSGSTLSVKIKGFSKTSATYTCTQAADNRIFPDIGSYYNGCSVDLSIPSTTNSSLTNTYGMHRKDTSVKSFTYSEACQIGVTFEPPSLVKGSINCKDLVQTHLESGIRNPIVPEVKATVSEGSTFSCNL